MARTATRETAALRTTKRGDGPAMEAMKRLHKAVSSAVLWLIPRPIRIRLSAEGFGILKFMEFAAKEIKPGERVLDAGAGTCPYKPMLAHAVYESTDWQNYPGVTHTFTCDLHQIPQPDNTYDSIVCTQVLQHVEYPQTVVKEFRRILKPGARLFLTAAQGWGVMSRHHYYNFACWGLESLFRNAGFRIVFIRPRGGMFWYLGHRLRTLPRYILVQYKKNIPAFICLLPFYLVGTVIFGFFVPLAMHCVDWIDKEQLFTLGYACCCIKDAARGDTPHEDRRENEG